MQVRTRSWLSASLRNLAVGVLAAASVAAAAQTRFPRSPDTVIPRAYFGMHVHSADDGTAWPGIEVGAWRLWDVRALWADIEPQPEAWNFRKLDRLVAIGTAAKAEINYVFGMTPQWASARPEEKGLYRKFGDRAEPANLADFERMVSTVVTRYRGRIRQYELWNEVNEGTGFFSGTQEALLAMQRSAYRIVKQIDPQAIFVAPSVVGEADHQVAWFERYMARGASDHADVISYHFYQPRKRPEEIVGLVRRIRAIMDRNGAAGKPLWNTESGYRMDYGQTKVVAADPTWPALSRDRAAAYVARALILGWWAGLDRFYWYAWDNVDMGLLGPSKEVTPAAIAFLTVARWMSGARLLECTKQRTLWRCGLARGQSRAWIVWSEDDQPQQVPVALYPDAVAMEGLDGMVSALTGPVSVDGRPVLLSEDVNAWRKSAR